MHTCSTQPYFHVCPRKTHTKTEKIQSLYVRRELRKLSDSDRDAYLNAFKIMTSTSTKDGKAVYGKHYKDLDEFSVRRGCTFCYDMDATKI